MNRLMNRLAEARPARLDPAAGTDPDPAEIMAHPRSARPGRRLPRRLVLAALVPAAALAIAVAVVAPSSTPPGAPARTAPDVLLVAAERAGADRAGAWWVTEAEFGSGERGPKGSYRRAGPLAGSSLWAG